MQLINALLAAQPNWQRRTSATTRFATGPICVLVCVCLCEGCVLVCVCVCVNKILAYVSLCVCVCVNEILAKFATGPICICPFCVCE